MTHEPFHPFVSDRARVRYLEHLEQRARSWPIACTCRTIDTAHGRTFVRMSGPVDGPPLVLLPGGGAHSLMWIPNIAALSEHHRTCALDHITDVGLSVNTIAIETVADLTDWLDGLFDALQLGPRIRLLGLSHGAWLAANYAQRHPARIEKLVLLAPVGWVQPLRLASILSMVLMLLQPRRHFIRRAYRASLPDLARAGAEGQQLIDAMTEDLALGFECFGVRRLTRMLEPTVVDDETLRSWQVPTQFIIGEHERLYACQQALARLQRVAPQISRVLIEGAGHDMTWLKPDIVNRAVLDFLSAASDSRSRP